MQKRQEPVGGLVLRWKKLSDLVMVSCENEHVAWMHLAAASSADSHGFPPYKK